MVGSSLASVASVLFVLSFSATSTVPTIEPPEMARFQTTAGGASVQNQSGGSIPAGQEVPPAQKADPLQRPLPQKKKFAKRSREGSAYAHWLDEEVPWIVTEEERAAFKLLSNDEEREKFIESFWIHRDPTPDTPENEYRDEYYRRVMYANERFSSGTPGSKTDRGRIYILHGPPDEIESHPTGGTYNYPQDQGGGSTQTYPFEVWRYRYIVDIGENVEIEFVDPCMCGDYHMTMDPNEKDAMAHVSAGQQRLQNSQRDTAKIFEDLDRFTKVTRPLRFKDLQEIVTHKFDYHTMPFDVVTNYVKATSNVTLVPVTLQIKNEDMTYKNENGVASGVVNIYGQVTTVGGRIAQTFEDTVQMNVPETLLQNMFGKASVYGKSLPLAPGRYLLEIVVKDVYSDHVGTWRHALEVPSFEEELSTSSVILADKMERVSPRDVGEGPFVIGDMLVRPRVPSMASKAAVFKRGERVNIWMQVYNLAVDEKDGKSDASVEFDVVKEGTTKTLLHGTQPAEMTHRAAGPLTLEKTIPVNGLEPGLYRLKVHVRDQIAKQGVDPEARFAIE